MNKSIVVITPVYQENISKNELLTVKSTQQHLYHYDRVIIAPKKFSDNLDFIKKWNRYGYKIAFLEDKYFTSSESYNNLMLESSFYELFSNYDYMLIVQLDVLIFSNSLSYWTDQEIDYVGAPWITKNYSGLHFNYAGNGGLSLRKIKTFIEVLNTKNLYKKDAYLNILPIESNIKNILLIKLLLKFPMKMSASIFMKFYKGNEDIFWTFYAPLFIEEFKIANLKDSLAFAFERYPKFCFEQNNYTFPFGVHAWNKHNPKFWKKYKASLFNSIHLNKTSNSINKQESIKTIS